ncbi:CAZyme family CE10 [Penicillium herquei]|nr:CAZyme family CE10 [Penicillium herquei]
METSRRPYLKDLAHRGVIQGVTISTGSGATSSDLCHYFGGVRYALPPVQRWRRARQLPASYTYGDRQQPGQCDSGAGLCPQPGFMELSPSNEAAWTEDCFQCNVWVPTEEPPKGGWPVFVFIHGGWLQFGSPNGFNAAALLGETDFKAVLVMPAYRVNLFGFLYSSELAEDAAAVSETVGNHGFWDQRMALEWIKGNIHLFGGNSNNITISGYSAGANSVFHQLAYDLRQPDSESIVRQACMFSNSPAVQPKSPAETQAQFNQLLTAVGIPLTLSANQKIARLRALPPRTLLDAGKSIDIHQFRPTTDSGFILPTLFQSLDNGEFARDMLRRNVRLMLGECSDERYLYAVWFPPKANTLSALRTRLIADYPEKIVDAVLPLHYPDGKLPADCKDWVSDAWGKIYADMQVYHMQRGLIHALTSNTGNVDASRLIHRYRIEYRAKCMDNAFPIEWGVTHSSDYPIWFWGNGNVLTPAEKKSTHEAFIGPLGRFIQGPDATGPDGFGWGTSGREGVRTLKSDRTVVIQKDALWEEGVNIWNALRSVDQAKPKL